MKKPILSFLPICLMFFCFYSCQHEVGILPMVGKVSFSLSPLTSADDRVKETAIPAFVLLRIKDRTGKQLGDIKLSLTPFEQSYKSEDLELQTGSYQLTQVEVLDSNDNIIYVTPLNGSDLAKYGTDPLPTTITIENTDITTQVLLALADQQDSQIVDLEIMLDYPAIAAFDSADIVFKNSTSELRLKLSLNDSAHIATGHIALPSGDWSISTSYYSAIIKNLESVESKGVVDLSITSTATALISDGDIVYIKDASTPILKSFTWLEHYYYYLYLNNKYEGFVRLPKDPLDPFIEISAFDAKWIYAYADRSFYNRSLDGSSNYFQGGAAFEVYDDVEDIIDTTSLASGLAEVSHKVWNYVDSIIILVDDTGENELLIYHVWDSTTNGRTRPSSPIWTKTQIDKRKQLRLTN